MNVASSFESPDKRRKYNQAKKLAAHIRKLWYYELALWTKMFLGRDESVERQYQPTWDGNERTGKISAWEKAAHKCIDLKVQPGVLIRAIFSGRTESQPFPNLLTATSSLTRYYKYEAKLCNELEQNLLVQQATALSEFKRAQLLLEMNSRNTWIHVLTSSSVALSPLFRYIGAKSESLDEIAEMWRASAIAEYLRAPLHYNSTWKELIPEELRKEAEEFVVV